MEKELAKALIARCPQCGGISEQPVESYRTALKASRVWSFECMRCRLEFLAGAAEFRLGVMHRKHAA